MDRGVFGVIAPHPPIMVPEVGGARARVTSRSMDALRHAAELLRRFDPDTVVIMSPHSPAMTDAFVVETAARTRGSLAGFDAPQVALAYDGDPELATRLLEELDGAGIPAIDRAAIGSLRSGELDHGVLVPMYFLDPEGRYALVELSLSYLPFETHHAVGAAIARAAAFVSRRVAFVASGDCSHRLTRDAPAGYEPDASAFDEYLVNTLRTEGPVGLLDTDPARAESAGECGLRSFITLGGFAPDAPTEVLSYEGPWGVGYLTAVVGMGAMPDDGGRDGMPGDAEHPLVSLARETIVRHVSGRDPGSRTSLDGLDLPARAGVFVSLHRNGALRGCIGTISPMTPTLAEEVAHNAVEASAHDPRFEPVDATELDDLDIHVDVLHEPEPATPEQLDPARYGVIVSSGWKRGLLLPDLDGVDTVEQQIDIARRKAGIRPDEPVDLERFRVDRYA